MKPKDSNSRDEIRGALEAVAQAKNISIDTLLEALATAMLTAYKRLPESEEYAIATIDPDTFEIRIIAQELDEDFNVLREWDHTPNETFMQRVMAQTVKQVMSQRIREVERDQKYEDYAGREGQIVTGIVQQVDQRFTLLDLGKVEALLPSAEQVPHERFERSARLKAYIVEVRKTTKGPQIVVSRTHPGLILRLFELEVPEIASGIVEIKACAREPGHRTKIAVYSHDNNVDPVGSCVGARGARVRMVTNELRGEKVDIVPFSEDPAEFVMRALQPAKVREVRLDDMTGVATVVVNDYQLSLAIGREGQNARLAGRLTGWEIQIKSESQLAEEEAGYAEGEWIERDGEMVWQPADGGEAMSAEAYYAEASGQGAEDSAAEGEASVDAAPDVEPEAEAEAAGEAEAEPDPVVDPEPGA
jgi:N utilization substance protein A